MTSILATNAKLDRIVEMVTSSQAAMQHSIEELCAEVKKDQEETAEWAVKKPAFLPSSISGRRRKRSCLYHFTFNSCPYSVASRCGCMLLRWGVWPLQEELPSSCWCKYQTISFECRQCCVGAVTCDDNALLTMPPNDIVPKFHCDIEKGDVECTSVWEVEVAQQTTIKVQGCLKDHLAYWVNVLKAAGFNQAWLCVTLISYLSTYFAPNDPSANSHQVFVNQAIQELVDGNGIVQVDTRLFICSPFFVVESSSKKRPVINLRHLNRSSFQYEDFRTALLLFEKGDMAFTFDLKSGYHHVNIHQSCWKYSGFAWCLDGVPSYFVLKVLPFGLSSACYCFTKLFRPLVKYWQGHGHKVAVYLDDNICSVQADRAMAASKFIQDSLSKAGFVSFQVSWLGFDIDL